MNLRPASQISIPEISDLVLACLRGVLAHDSGTEARLDATTRLVGRESVLDSLGLVTLIVDVEDELMTRYGVSVTLADERAMSQTRSPFLTVHTVAEYVHSLLSDRR